MAKYVVLGATGQTGAATTTALVEHDVEANRALLNIEMNQVGTGTSQNLR